MEWLDPYNPFNSMKGLLWEDSHYKPIRAWFRGDGDIPPPIELSLDPIHACNFKCPHCNAQRYLNSSESQSLPKLDAYDTLSIAWGWGVNGLCIGGGGEPLMSKWADGFIWDTSQLGIECAVATNGYLINKEVAENMMYCKWVAISVDAASRETFKKVHGVDGWGKVIDNIALLVKTKEETGSGVAIDFRFLITPDNWKEIGTACYIAAARGVDAFHARVADLERKDVPMDGRYDWVAKQEISRQLEGCHHYNSDTFKVYTTTHKFDSDFKPKNNFKKCTASPLVWQACADGNSYVCPDHRLEGRFRLCKTMDIRDYWGSDHHREVLKSINVEKECSRCTWSSYQEQIEKLDSDPMHRFFP